MSKQKKGKADDDYTSDSGDDMRFGGDINDLKNRQADGSGQASK